MAAMAATAAAAAIEAAAQASKPRLLMANMLIPTSNPK
jgi:hypothetical protein